jgi:pimeloyl-ACP methyl ester carboxylesterase
LYPARRQIEDEGVGILGLVAVLVAAGALYQAVGATRQARRFAPPGRLIDVEGHRLHVRCSGSGTPLVLLESAIAASSLSWTVVLPRIAEFTRVCAYDRAGLAWSDPPSRPETFDRMVKELAAVLASVAPEDRYIVVGHSFGSFLVSAFAARHPARVAGMVLVDPPLEWLTIGPERARLLWGGRHLSRIGALLAHVGIVRACLALLTGGHPAGPRRFAKVFGPTTVRTLERIVGEVRKLPADVHPAVQAHWSNPKCFRALAAHLETLERDVATIARVRPPSTIPTIVISSRDQPQEQLAAHRELASRSVHGRHVIAAQSTHWIQFDEPDLVVSAVRELVLDTNTV